MTKYNRLLNHFALYSCRTVEWFQSCIDDPKWEEYEKIHDWRNHIPHYIENIWNDLSQEAQVVAVAMAAELADKEEWE